MTYNNQTNQYLEQQIHTASPAGKIIMLYDGAIKFLLKARMAVEENNIQARCNNVQRAMDIVCFLLDSVDTSDGDEAAKSLFRIYGMILKRMLDINFENAVTPVDEIITHLKRLRENWVELEKQLAQQPKSQESKPRSQTQSGYDADGKPITFVRTALA